MVIKIIVPICRGLFLNMYLFYFVFFEQANKDDRNKNCLSCSFDVFRISDSDSGLHLNLHLHIGYKGFQ